MNHERYAVHSVHGIFRLFDTEAAEYLIGLYESRYDALCRIGRMTGAPVWRVVATCGLHEDQDGHGPHTSVILGVGVFPCPEVLYEGLSEREATEAASDRRHVNVYRDGREFVMPFVPRPR